MTHSDFSEKKQQELLAEAKTQLMKYAAETRVIKRSQGATLKCLALVFCGWELKVAEEYDFIGNTG